MGVLAAVDLTGWYVGYIVAGVLITVVVILVAIILGLARRTVVLKERLGLIVAVRDEDARHHGVDLTSGLRRDACGECFADAVVIHLDQIRRATVANQMFRPETRHERPLIAGEATRFLDTRRPYRASAERQRLDEDCRLFRQRGEAADQHFTERGPA